MSSEEVSESEEHLALSEDVEWLLTQYASRYGIDLFYQNLCNLINLEHNLSPHPVVLTKIETYFTKLRFCYTKETKIDGKKTSYTSSLEITKS